MCLMYHAPLYTVKWQRVSCKGHHCDFTGGGSLGRNDPWALKRCHLRANNIKRFVSLTTSANLRDMIYKHIRRQFWQQLLPNSIFGNSCSLYVCSAIRVISFKVILSTRVLIVTSSKGNTSKSCLFSAVASPHLQILLTSFMRIRMKQ